MRPDVRAGWLVRLYPARWRARYEGEFLALLEQEPGSTALFLDIIRGALVAHAAPSPSPGGLTMDGRHRTQALASALAVLLVLPAVVFLTAAAVRLMQPRQHQPSAAAWAIFDFFTGGTLPQGSGLVLLGVAPAIALLIGIAVAWNVLMRDADARADVAAFLDGVRRLARHPSLVGAALAFLAALAVLTFAIDHAIAG